MAYAGPLDVWRHDGAIACLPRPRSRSHDPGHAIVLSSPHAPYIHNGEEEMAGYLRRLGISYEYEARFYALQYAYGPDQHLRYGGFVPDFYLLPTPQRPGVNLEVTFADHGLPSMSRSQWLANQRRLKLKQHKIELTQLNYGVETILVTRAVFLHIRRDQRYLERLIRGAATRHYRRLRQAS